MLAANDDSQLNVDDLIERLLEGQSINKHCRTIPMLGFFLFKVRECRPPGKLVEMSEQEMYHLCDKSKDIFLSQPMLLELKAPINICGTFKGELNWFH